MHETSKTKGSVKIFRTDSEGNTSLIFEDDNLIVKLGKALIAARLVADGPKPTHIGIGTGTTAATLNDTDLTTTLGSRKAAATSIITTTLTNDTAVFTATFAPGEATGTWQEAGLFTAASAGTLCAHILTEAQTKGALDTFSLEWHIQSL